MASFLKCFDFRVPCRIHVNCIVQMLKEIGVFSKGLVWPRRSCDFEEHAKN